MTFSWVDPLIALGSSKDMTDADVPNLSPTQTTATSFNLLQHTAGSNLLRRLLKANAYDLFMDAIGTIAASFCSFLSPYFIKQILEGISAPTREKVARAYIYVVLALFVSIFKALIDLQHLWYGRRACVRIKNQLIAAVYDKALRRKDASGVIAEKDDAGKDDKKGDKKAEVKKSSDSGRVVNLMASDANNVANTVSGMYWVYGAPVQIVIALAFLYSLLGWSESCWSDISIDGVLNQLS
jgi:ABC-type multidrug transport system fused ATPase/permease subunit